MALRVFTWGWLSWEGVSWPAMEPTGPETRLPPPPAAPSIVVQEANRAAETTARRRGPRASRDEDGAGSPAPRFGMRLMNFVNKGPAGRNETIRRSPDLVKEDF